MLRFIKQYWSTNLPYYRRNPFGKAFDNLAFTGTYKMPTPFPVHPIAGEWKNCCIPALNFTMGQVLDK
ncbi:MAG: hypothetical protein RLZZ28_2668 [Bacteroidota bacterium]|jgi:hypothetical protein